MKRLILLLFLCALGFYAVWPSITGYRIYQGLEGNDPKLLAAKINFPSVRQSMRAPVLAQVNRRIETVMKDLGPATAVVGDQIPRDNVEKIIDGALERVVTAESMADIYSNGSDLNAAIKDAVLAEIDEMGGIVSVLKLDRLLGGAEAKDGEATIGGFKVPGGLGGLLKSKELNSVVGDLASKYGLDAAKLAKKLFPSRVANETQAVPDSRDGSKQSFGLGNIKSFTLAGPLAMRAGVSRDDEKSQPDVTVEMAFQNYDWRVTQVIPNLSER